MLFHLLSVRKHKTHQSYKSTTSDERLRCTLHEIVKNYLARIWLALARIWRSAAPPRKLYLVISILHVIRIPILLCFFKKRGDEEVWSDVQRRALLDRTKHGHAEGAKNADNSKNTAKLLLNTQNYSDGHSSICPSPVRSTSTLLLTAQNCSVGGHSFICPAS